MATRHCSRHRGDLTVILELGISKDKGRGGGRSGGMKNFEGKDEGCLWQSTKDILISNVT